MRHPSRSPQSNRPRLAAIASGALLALAVSTPASWAEEITEFNAVRLAAGAFLMDDVAMQIRSRLGTRSETQVFHLRDASHMVILRVQIPAGGHAPYHSHPSGTGLLVNTGPGTITNFLSDDCLPRVYGPGEAFVDPGHDTVHGVHNLSNEAVTLYAIFFGVDDPTALVVPEGTPHLCPPPPM